MMNADPTNAPDKKQWKPLDPAAHFSVPDGYFDSLKSKVFDRIRMEEEAPEEAAALLHEEEQAQEAKRPLRIVLRPYLYLAAMFVGLALLFKALPLIMPDELTSSQKVQALTEQEFLRQITEEEFDQYLLEETQDEYLMATVFE